MHALDLELHRGELRREREHARGQLLAHGEKLEARLPRLDLPGALAQHVREEGLDARGGRRAADFVRDGLEIREQRRVGDGLGRPCTPWMQRSAACARTCSASSGTAGGAPARSVTLQPARHASDVAASARVMRETMPAAKSA